MAAYADLILTNARVITFDPALPSAGAVAVSGEKILAVGSEQDIDNLRKPHTRIIDCRGLSLVPGLIDAHCHLLASASSLTGVNCSPVSIASIADLKTAIARRAGELPPGRWIRGFGLDPVGLTERRYPTRQDLDSAAPHHPVRLDHGSGHAAVLNSRGLRLAGIDAATPDPPEGIIHRDEESGEPDGLLLELSGFLRARLGNTRSAEEFEDGIARLNRKLLSYGITSVHDAGPNNRPSHWETFRSLTESGQLTPRVMLMAGVSHLAEFAAAGLGWGAGDNRLRLGHAKIMLTLTTGALHPGPAELKELVASAHQSGFPVAIHAVEEEAVAAALNLEEMNHRLVTVPVESLPVGEWQPRPRNRVEHCAECPPGLVTRLALSGAVVVTQPGFIYWRGDGYLERVEERLLPHLYPIAALARAGIPLAFGSDSPVIDPNPWPAIYSAVTRRTASGKSLPGERAGIEAAGSSAPALKIFDALRTYTRGGSIAEGAESRKGAIRTGMLTDLVVVDSDLAGADAGRVRDTKVRLTVVGGQVVWDDGIGE